MAIIEAQFTIMNNLEPREAGSNVIDARFRLPLLPGSVVCRWAVEDDEGKLVDAKPVPSHYLKQYRQEKMQEEEPQQNTGNRNYGNGSSLDVGGIESSCSDQLDEHDHSFNAVVPGLPYMKPRKVSVAFKTDFRAYHEMGGAGDQSIVWECSLPFSFKKPVQSITLDSFCYPIDEFHWEFTDNLPADNSSTTIADGVEFRAATTVASVTEEEEEFTKRLVESVARLVLDENWWWFPLPARIPLSTKIVFVL